jgi:SAM-dependent methyltransferase
MSKLKDWDVVVKMIKLDGKKILDFGCSRGEFFDFLKARRVKFDGVGYDIDKSLKKLDLKFRIYSDLNKIKEKFDIVTMFEVIEHMKPDEAMEKLKMIRNILKEDGILIISTRNISSLKQAWEFWYDITHVRPYPIKDLVFLVENCGFDFIDLIRTECSINPFYLILCIILKKDWCNGYVAIFRKRKNTYD